MKATELMTFAILSLGLFLLSAIIPSSEGDLYVGAYGTSDVSLVLNADQTFQFMHDPRSIEASGTWEYDGKRIRLSKTSNGASIPEKWSPDGDDPCLKSELHKGETLRLCACSP